MSHPTAGQRVRLWRSLPPEDGLRAGALGVVVCLNPNTYGVLFDGDSISGDVRLGTTINGIYYSILDLCGLVSIDTI
jgi:hypothetical protein